MDAVLLVDSLRGSANGVAGVVDLADANGFSPGCSELHSEHPDFRILNSLHNLTIFYILGRVRIAKEDKEDWMVIG